MYLGSAFSRVPLGKSHSAKRNNRKLIRKSNTTSKGMCNKSYLRILLLVLLASFYHASFYDIRLQIADFRELNLINGISALVL